MARRDKSYEIESRECRVINSALSDQADVSGARVLAVNGGGMLRGTIPAALGLHVGQRRREGDPECGPAEPQSRLAVPRRADMLTAGRPKRWVIDFQMMSIFEAKAYAIPFSRVEKLVLPTSWKRHARNGSRPGERRTGSELAGDVVAAFSAASGVDPETRSPPAVHRVLPGHKAADLRLPVNADPAGGCSVVLRPQRRLQFRRPPIELPLAVVRRKVLKAQVRLPLHAGIGF